MIRMNLRKMGLKPKIVVGFGSLLAIIVGMGLVGYRSAWLARRLAGRVSVLPYERHEQCVARGPAYQRVGERDILMGKGNDTLRLYEHGEEDFRNAMEDLHATSSDDAREQFARIELARENYVAARPGGGHVPSGGRNGANEMFRSLREGGERRAGICHE